MAEVETNITEKMEGTEDTVVKEKPAEGKEATGKKVETKEETKGKAVKENDKDEKSETKEEKKSDKEVSNDAIEGINLLAQGKRNILCGEIPQAVNQLQDACRLLAAAFGETADQCGEAYLTYGSALLDLSRMESGVLGNALQGIDEDEEEGSSKDDSQVEDPEKLTDSEESKEGDTEEEEEEEEEAEKSEDIEADEGEEGKEKEEGDTEEEEAGNSDDKKEEEDVSNLQLAWEVLELAKVIYSRHDKKEMKLKTAESFLKLGEVGLETDQYDQAIEDFKSCLSIQKKHLEADSRLVAHTNYQIGLACTSAGRYDEAIESYKNAVNVLEERIANLNKIIEDAEKEGKGKEPVSFDDPVSEAQKEITDLKELLPDILAKIEDTEDEKKNQEKVKQMVKENLSADFGTTSVGFGESTTSSAAPAEKTEAEPVSDISHLVRKKRKPEEDSVAEESKKPRQETDAAGDGPHVNGTEKTAEMDTTPAAETKV